MKIGKIPLGLIALLLLLNYGSCLKNVELHHSPEVVHVGDEVKLSASYQLEGGESIYSIKFCKDNVEFFRHAPSARPSNMVFSVPGLKIDTNRSDESTVYLLDVTATTSGRYSVEVSLDAPHFTTIMASMELQVPTHNNTTNIKAEPSAAGKNDTPIVNLKYLRLMEEELGKPKEEWPKDIVDLILGQPKDVFDIIKIASFAYLNNVSPHTLDQLLRETNASKALIDSTSTVFSLYDVWTYSKDLRKLAVAYCVERQGYFNMDQEPKSPPVNRGATPPCDCHCVKDTNKINGTLPSLALEKHP